MYHSQAQKMVQMGEFIVRDIQGKLNADERAVLESWLAESETNRETYTRCFDAHARENAHQILDHLDSHKAYARVKRTLAREAAPRDAGRIFKRMLPYVAAACLVLLIGLGWYGLQYVNTKPATEPATVAQIRPGGYKASVTFSDGRVFELDAQEKAVRIDGAAVSYQSGQPVAAIDAVQSATIETPRGGIYDVILPDGTKVKLNAASALTYPTVFGKDKREVTLVGEAYFEVAKNTALPFVVHTKQQQVSVLGTHFNVEAYSDATETKTTLLEGKVRVQSHASNESMVLMPAQQSVLKGTNIEKRDVDVMQEVAWVYGKFNFDGKKLRQVMNELARWYNVTVVYQGDVPNIEFFGGTFRSSQLSTILNILKSHGIRYQLTSDGRLILTADKNIQSTN